MVYFILGLFIFFFGSVSLSRRYRTFIYLIKRYLYGRLILVLLFSLFLFLELFLYLENICVGVVALICLVINTHVCYFVVLCLPEKEGFAFLAQHQSNIWNFHAIHAYCDGFTGRLEELQLAKSHMKW